MIYDSVSSSMTCSTVDTMFPSALVTNRLLRVPEINDVKDRWNISLCYIIGYDIRLYNPKRAFELLQRLLDDGYEFAKIPLAIMYKNGIGINKDEVTAEAYWKWVKEMLRDNKYIQISLEEQIPGDHNWKKFIQGFWEETNRIGGEIYTTTRTDYDSQSVTDMTYSDSSSSTISE